MARARNRARGNAKPYFHGAGRILGRASRLYGYSILLSGFSSLFLSGFSSLPLTKWDDKGGVPQAHVGLVSVLLKLWCGLCVSSDGGPARRSDLPLSCLHSEQKLTTSKMLFCLCTSTSKDFAYVRVQHLVSQPVPRSRRTALVRAIRVVRDVRWKYDRTSLEHLCLHWSPSRPRNQPQIFHAGRVSRACGYI